MAKDVFTAPWYPWYVRDVLTSERVDLLTLAEEGAYRRALDKAWMIGSIPANARDAAAVIGNRCTVKIAERVLTMFTADPKRPDRMINIRLEKVRKEQEKKYKKRSRAGKENIGKRWKQTTSGDSNGIPTAKHTDSDTDSSKEESKNGVPPVAAVAAEIEPVMRRIWTDGKDLLRKGGMSEHSLGPFLGKLVKEHGRSLVAESIAATQAENAADPKTFLLGVLRTRSPKNRPQVGRSLPSTAADFTEECLTCFDTGSVIVRDDEGRMIGDEVCPECSQRAAPA